MELVVRTKQTKQHYKCIPGFVNIMDDGRFMVREGAAEKMREMEFYDVYIKPVDIWLDLWYAYCEGFLDPEQLRKWP